MKPNAPRPRLRGTTVKVIAGPDAGKTGQIIQEPLRRHVVIQFPNRRAITIALDKLELQSQTVCAQT